MQASVVGARSASVRSVAGTAGPSDVAWKGLLPDAGALDEIGLDDCWRVAL